MSKKRPVNYIFYIFILLIIVFSFYRFDFLNKINYPLIYEEDISESALEYDIDSYLIYAVIKAESSFYPYAKSRKDAKGLMQISDMTWNWASEEMVTINKNPFIISDNIKVGSWYLSKLIGHYGNIQIALLAYNAGSGNVDEWIKEGRLMDPDHTKWDIPFNESKRYIEKITKYHKQYIRIYGEKNEEI